jgi:hypothetical protein
MLRMPFVVVALLVLLAPAARADGASSAQTAAKAAQDLTSYNDGVVKKNERPVFDKPPASQYLAQVLDGKALAALPRPAASDMSWLMQWAEAMNKVNQLLIFTGAKSNSEADQRAAIERNMVDYEDVMFPAWAFMARLQTRMLLSADLFMAALKPEDRTPARQGGLAKIRNGHMQFVQGGLTTIAAGVKPQNAKLLTAALRETAPTWAPRINEPEQSRLRSTLTEAKQVYTDPALLDELGGLTLMIDGVKPQ